MPDLTDLLYPWPVVSALASYLGVGDLLHLSRVNSEFRAVLHGFPRPKPQVKQSTALAIHDDGMKEGVRADIFVGLHQNSNWKHLKSTADMSCTEPGHRKGYHVGLCRYCSNPVCDACVVRVSLFFLFLFCVCFLFSPETVRLTSIMTGIIHSEN